MTSALVVCGDQLYANVEGMTPAQRVHGAIQNALGLADHEAVVFDATFLGAPEPFDAREACREEQDKLQSLAPPSRSTTPMPMARPGAELESSVERWLGFWGGLQLGEPHGRTLTLAPILTLTPALTLTLTPTLTLPQIGRASSPR